MSGLIWVQTVCKGYQQTTLVGKELTNFETHLHALWSWFAFRFISELKESEKCSIMKTNIVIF